MTQMPSPEQFLQQESTEEDEDDTDQQVPQPQPFLGPAIERASIRPPAVAEMSPYDPSPLDSIAQSLRELVARQPAPAVCTRCVELTDEVQSYREAADDLAYKHQTVVELVEEIEATIKKSTSKLANDVRAAIGRWREPVLPEPEVDSETYPVVGPGGSAVSGDQPADDADVETWRAFARQRGFQGPDVDTMNRSQIRTMLGIPHPGQA